MSFKIPCGGFYLSDTLGVDENGRLGVNGGEPYKSLVTDGEGNAKWEDRLAYEDKQIVPALNIVWDGNTEGLYCPNPSAPAPTYKVSNLVPCEEQIPTLIWDGESYGGFDVMRAIDVLDTNPDYNTDEYFQFADSGTIIAKKDNVTIPKYVLAATEITVAEKGVYLTKASTLVGDSVEVIGVKPIDKKFIPSELNEVILQSSTPSSTKKFKITVDDSGTLKTTEI